MFRMHAVYPNGPEAKFDFDYYSNEHMKLVHEKLSPFGLKGASFQQCAPNPDGSPAAYVAVAMIDFESAEKFQEAFGAAAPDLMGDIPNFTNITPTLTIGPVVS